MAKSTVTTALTRPPIVVVLGHVDHGKTTLLDTIRKTQVAKSEHGGITQHIGAYQVTTAGGQRITFIDTPGHEIFAKIRFRGSNIADIALLVISAVDGVMPQTVESIELIKKEGIPFIVVLNKIDLPSPDPDKIKQQLTKYGILIEGYGGDIVMHPLSAKTGQGVPELLDLILLVMEIKGLRVENTPEIAVVIESHVDRHKGALATVVSKSEALHIGQLLYTKSGQLKIRAIIDERGQMIQSSAKGQPVELMGWVCLPAVGTAIYTAIYKETVVSGADLVKPDIKSLGLTPLETLKKLKIILKTDVSGSLEAILEKLTDSVDVVSSQTGDVTESDVLIAKSSGAFIIGFNVKVIKSAKKLAQIEAVRIKTYTIIYELLDEIVEVTELLNSPTQREETLGEAEIVAEFHSDKLRVAGCQVRLGRIARGDPVILKRKDEEIGRTKIKSLKAKKEDIPKSEAGSECGIVLDKQLDFKIRDLIISYKIHELLT